MNRIRWRAWAIAAALVLQVAMAGGMAGAATPGLTLTVSPQNPAPGQRVTISGTLTGASAAGVGIQVDDPSGNVAFLYEPAPDASGDFSVTFTLPATSATGAYTVYASAPTGSGTLSANATFGVSTQLAITTSSLPDGTVGQAYAATLAATGGAGGDTWSVSGAPSWLQLDASTGALSGTPTAAGSSTLNVTVTDSASHTATASLPLTVNAAPFVGGGGGGGAPPSTPTTVPLSQSVGSSGGTLATSDGAFSLSVPARALADGQTLSLSESCGSPKGIPSGLTAAGCVFALAGGALNPPLVATIQYDAAALKGLAADRVSAYVQNADGSWSFRPTRVDAAGGTLQVDVGGPETLAVLANLQVFPDVPASYWAASDIDVLLAADVVNGFPDGTFQPGGALTRAQFVKMLVLAMGIAPSDAATKFSDVPAGAWFAPYVSAAVQQGLVAGTSPATFSPDATVTREQMAVLLSRALKLSGTTTLTFSDAGQIQGWALSGVQAAVAAGYLVGFPDGTFQPLGPTTRAQASKVLAEAIAHLAPPS